MMTDVQDNTSPTAQCSQVATSLEQAIGRARRVPNRYEGFPEPIIVEMESSWHRGWKYHRALCPIKFCKYEGLPHGFNQHYARTHAPEQWRQHAKRVLKEVRV